MSIDTASYARKTEQSAIPMLKSLNSDVKSVLKFTVSLLNISISVSRQRVEYRALSATHHVEFYCVSRNMACTYRTKRQINRSAVNCWTPSTTRSVPLPLAQNCTRINLFQDVIKVKVKITL